VEAFGHSVVLREAEQPGYLFFPPVQRTSTTHADIDTTLVIAISGRPSTILSTGLSFVGRNGCPAGISHPWYAFLFFVAPFFEREA